APCPKACRTKRRPWFRTPTKTVAFEKNLSAPDFDRRLPATLDRPGGDTRKDALGAVVMERVLQCSSSPQRNDRPDARSARPRRNAGHAGVSDRCESRQTLSRRQSTCLHRLAVRGLSPHPRHSPKHTPQL